MPRPGTGRGGQQHAHAGGGKDVEHICQTHGTEFREAGEQPEDLQEIAQPDAGTEGEEGQWTVKPRNGTHAFPQVDEEAADVGPERKTDAHEQTHRTANNNIKGVARYGPDDALVHALHQSHRFAPAQRNGQADDDEQAGYVGQLLHHHCAQRTRGDLRIAALHEERARQFAQARRDAVDEVGDEHQFHRAARGDGDVGRREQHLPSQRTQHVGEYPHGEHQRNPQVVGPLREKIGQQSYVEATVNPPHQETAHQGREQEKNDLFGYMVHDRLFQRLFNVRHTRFTTRRM